MRKMYQPSYSNWQIVFAGQGGTTAERIIVTRKWERIKIGNNPVSLLANTAPQKNRIKQISIQKVRRNKGNWNTILSKIVEEYNSQHTYNYLTQYLKDEKDGGLFRDYFEGRTNGRLYKENNGKYLLFIREGKKLKVVC